MGFNRYESKLGSLVDHGFREDDVRHIHRPDARRLLSAALASCLRMEAPVGAANPGYHGRLEAEAALSFLAEVCETAMDYDRERANEARQHGQKVFHAVCAAGWDYHHGNRVLPSFLHGLHHTLIAVEGALGNTGPDPKIIGQIEMVWGIERDRIWKDATRTAPERALSIAAIDADIKTIWEQRSHRR